MSKSATITPAEARALLHAITPFPRAVGPTPPEKVLDMADGRSEKTSIKRAWKKLYEASSGSPS